MWFIAQIKGLDALDGRVFKYTHDTTLNNNKLWLCFNSCYSGRLSKLMLGSKETHSDYDNLFGTEF